MTTTKISFEEEQDVDSDMIVENADESSSVSWEDDDIRKLCNQYFSLSVSYLKLCQIRYSKMKQLAENKYFFCLFLNESFTDFIKIALRERKGTKETRNNYCLMNGRCKNHSDFNHETVTCRNYRLFCKTHDDIINECYELYLYDICSIDKLSIYLYATSADCSCL